MFVIKHRKIFYTITALISGIALAFILYFGLSASIEFTGGILAEVKYEGERPAQELVESHLKSNNIENFSIRPLSKKRYILRAHKFTEREDVTKAFAVENKEFTLEKFSSIGPVIGEELKDKASFAMILSIFALIFFITIAFRKVSNFSEIEESSKKVGSLKYGLIAILALLHDMLIPVGVFALVAYLVGIEVDILFITALLTILGYSVNDTIVVFDRIRENIQLNRKESGKENFEKIVGKSLKQVYPRSINTSLTTIFVLCTLLFLGASATWHFALVLLVGVIAGTYSSIFLAAPLLVTIENAKKKKANK